MAARLRRLDENAQIQIYDKGPDIAFSNCCLPNFLSREVPEADNLILFTPADFKKMFNLEALTGHEVIAIHPQEHTVLVRNLSTGEELEDRYDALILSPGAKAVVPPSIPGITGSNVFTVRNVADVRALDHYLHTHNVQDVAVVGGGFIGLEVAENLTKTGRYTVSVAEAAPQVMMPLDEDLVQILHKELLDRGVNLYLGDALAAVHPDKITLASGKEIPAGCVVLAIGVKPDLDFAVRSGLAVGETGGALVNAYYETNLPDVYAVGDCIETFNALTRAKTKLPLAGPAQRAARACADHLMGHFAQNRGVIGSSCLRLFDLNIAATGLNERECQKHGIPYMTSYVLPFDRVGVIPGANVIHLKLIFEDPTGRLLGCQAVGKGNVVDRVDVAAALLGKGGTLQDLAQTELCYAPTFRTAKDALHFAAYVGLNLLSGEFKQVPMREVRALVESGATIIDVREAPAYKRSHIKGAVNIPLSQIRERYREIPQDVPVYLHCRTAWYSYYAVRALQGLGFRNIINLQGSFLGLSYYEYFRDKTTGRTPILTDYNFF